MKIIERIKQMFSKEYQQNEKTNRISYSEEDRQIRVKLFGEHYLSFLDYLEGKISYSQLQTDMLLGQIQSEEDSRDKIEAELRKDPNSYPHKFASISHGKYNNICRHCGKHLHYMCAIDVCDQCRKEQTF